MSTRFLVFRLLPLCLCAITLLATLAPAAENEALEKRFREANDKLNANEIQPAIEIYNEILEIEPKAGNVWLMRAVAKRMLKDLSGARADIAQALSVDPDNIDAYRLRGQMRYEAQDYPSSRADFTKAIDALKRVVDRVDESEPEQVAAAREFMKRNAELYGMRAEVENKLNDSSAALEDLGRALQLKPDYIAAYFLRGQIYESEQRASEAEEDFSKVISLNPKHASAFNSRAWIRFHNLQWDDSIADAKQTLELQPQETSAMRVMGYAQFAKGDYAAAAATLAAAADSDPSSDAAYALFVRHYAMLRTGGADKRVATSWGNWKGSPWLQALAKFISGQIDEDALEAAAKDTSDDGELAGRACEMHFYIGLARKQAGDKSTARLRFQSAVKTEQKTYVEDALAQAELSRVK